MKFTSEYLIILNTIKYQTLITGRNEVLAKVIFLHLSVILFTGGGSGKETPPPAGWRNPPSWMEDPPSAGWRNPPGWRTPPAGWRTPRMEKPPPDRGTPPSAGWRNPPGMENPPREADSGIRSTIGRYASYWNAFLFLK